MSRKGLAKRVFAQLCTVCFVLLGCSRQDVYKPPLTPTVVQAYWFEPESTLFLFWDVQVEQGLHSDTRLEWSQQTEGDESFVSPLESSQVHLHEPADCPSDHLCGSATLALKSEPQAVRMRLRWDPTAPAYEPLQTQYWRVTADTGEKRSFLIYGVFDTSNTRIEWRGEHNFPGLAGSEADRLGLRRAWSVGKPTQGADSAFEIDETNPWLYQVRAKCPGTVSEPSPFEALAVGVQHVRHSRGALKKGDTLVSQVCAPSEVPVAGGATLKGTVWARRNPDVIPAFPALATPIREAKGVGLVLGLCRSEFDGEHLAMQKQRLGIEENAAVDVCLDNIPGDQLAGTIRAIALQRVNAERRLGANMVLNVLLHTQGPAEDLHRKSLAQALTTLLVTEAAIDSPHLKGAFVLDTAPSVLPETLSPGVLWCPSLVPGGSETIVQGCPVVGAPVGVQFGPLGFDALPILPSLSQYQNFLKKYPASYAGHVEKRSYLAPWFGAGTTHTFEIDSDKRGVTTWFSGEKVFPKPQEAYAVVPSPVTERVRVRRVDVVNSGGERGLFQAALPQEAASSPLVALPGMHLQDPIASWDLGLKWEFPFFMRLSYVNPLAGNVGAFGLSVPFRMDNNASSDGGWSDWQKTSWDLSRLFFLCRRWCNHPGTTSGGSYVMGSPWKIAFSALPHDPLLPHWNEGGE